MALKGLIDDADTMSVILVFIICHRQGGWTPDDEMVSNHIGNIRYLRAEV